MSAAVVLSGGLRTATCRVVASRVWAVRGLERRRVAWSCARSAAASVSGSSADQRLLRWLDDGGGRGGNRVLLGPAGPGLGRGLTLAPPHAYEGEVLLRLPRELAFSEESWTLSSPVASRERGASLIQALEPIEPEYQPSLKLACYLLVERGNPFSFWLPYLQLLPEDFPAVMESEDDVVLQHFMERSHCRAPGTPPFFLQLEIPTVAEMSWAWCAVRSRAFGLDDSIEALLPVIDSMNHSFAPNVEVKRRISGTWEAVALREIAPGEPLTICYGCHSNADLFWNYGFEVADNPYDIAT
eukprot:jgi/Chlat1/2998/Chrsp2S04715